MKNIHFYENINPNITYTLKSVPYSLGKDYIIRYLYRNLAYYVHRDLKFSLLEREEKIRQYSTIGFIDRFPDVVCSTLSEFYCAAFDEFGIEAKVVQANSASVPLFGVVADGERGKYFLNPLEDLFKIQYGLRPDSFGYIPRYNTIKKQYPNLFELDSDYIDEIDKKLGFTYINDFFDELKPKMVNFKTPCLFLGEECSSVLDVTKQKLDYFSKRLINLGNVEGVFERALLYQFFNDTLLNNREKVRVKKRIEDGLSNNPYISYSILWGDENIKYKEVKNGKVYSLVLDKKIIHSDNNK